MERYTLSTKETIFDVTTDKYIVANKLTFYLDRIIVTKGNTTKSYNYGEIGICHEDDLLENVTTSLNSYNDLISFRQKCKENNLYLN